MKKVLITGLALTTLVTTSVPAFAASATNLKTGSTAVVSNTVMGDKLTANSYISWLNEKIKTANGSEKKDLQTTLNQFKSLSKEKQAKFIQYINNPTDIINAANIAENGTSKLNANLITADKSMGSKLNYNDDIVVTKNLKVENDKSSTTNINALAYTDSRKATYTKTVSALGIDILQVTAWVRYTHNGSKVISVDSGDAFTAKNYNPMLTTSWSKINLGKSSNDTVAYAAADVTFGFLWKAVGLSYGSAEVGARGDIYNNADGWVTGY